MLLASTGYAAAIVARNSFADIFNGGTVQIFNGARPSTANAAPDGTNTLIAVITERGLPWAPDFNPYGLKFLQQGQYVLMDPLLAWQLVPNANASLGPAFWWRQVARGDDGLPSITRPRIDGDVGTKGVIDLVSQPELLLDSTTLNPGTFIPIFNFFYAIPPIPGA